MTRDPLGLRGGVNLYRAVGNNPVNWRDPFGLYYEFDWALAYGLDMTPLNPSPAGDVNFGVGFQAGGHIGIAGINGAAGLVLGGDGQACFVRTVCLRVGPGLYAGAGGYGAIGGTYGNTENVGGWSFGAGADIGAGPSAGGQISVGGSSIGVAKAKGGGGAGFSIGAEMCYTWTTCSNPICKK